MKTKQLMDPRLKVSEYGYPAMPFKKNEVLQLRTVSNGEVWLFYTKMDQFRESHINFPLEFFTAFPNLFRPLEWYEERTVEEMPGYITLKTARPVKIIKVDKWDFDIVDKCWWASYSNANNCLNMWAIAPSNEEEYNEYILSSKE